MGYVISNAEVGLPPIDSSEVLRSDLLGREFDAYDVDRGYGRFVYLKGVASTAIGSWVLINPDDWTTKLLDENDIGSVAVAMSANDAATDGGYYQVIGKASGLALADFADNGRVYATSTDGSVDDAVVDGDLVHNALGASTIVSAGLADFEINRPYCDDIAGND